MRNNMTREQMMRDVAEMNMRSRCNGQQGASEVVESICGERAAAGEDFSF